MVDALVEELGRVSYRSTAERCAGLPTGTVSAWLRRAKRSQARLQESGGEPNEKEQVELELLTRVLHAEAVVESDLSANVQHIALHSPDQKLQL